MAKAKVALVLPKTTTRLMLIDNVTGGVSRSADPNEEWDGDDTWESHSPQAWEISQNTYYDVIYPGTVKRGEDLYLVYAIYNTGDSFSRSDGQLDVIDAFKSVLNARKCADAAGKATGHSFSYQNDFGQPASHHTTWIGYFESLTGIYSVKLPVRK